MTFNHSFAAIALIQGALSYPVIADPIKVYGKVNASVQVTDDGLESFTELKSNASLFGVKGELDLDSGVKVFYKIEWDVDITDSSDSDNIKSRDQYLGLTGEFGSVILGRKNTGLRNLSNPVDVFNFYEADLKGLWKGENRLSDSLSYISPNLHGFSVELNYVAEESKESDSSLTASVYYGDKTFKKSKWFAGVARESGVKGYDIQRAVAKTKLGNWGLGVIAHQQKNISSGKADSGVTFSTSYSINKWKLKAQHQSLAEQNSIGFGIDYKLGKSTKAYGFYADRRHQETEHESWLGGGLEHKF